MNERCKRGNGQERKERMQKAKEVSEKWNRRGNMS